MTAPRVSICVPTYNGASYLNECLAGLLAQTFADFEVLIVDDGSKDETVVLARQWAERDARIVVHVNERNFGLVGNWERCLALARGEWIKFLFQDDLIEPDCLHRMLTIGESGGGFVACARAFLFEGEIDPAVRSWYDDHLEEVDAIFAGSPFLTPIDYVRTKLDHPGVNVIGEPSVTLIRRELFERHGGFDSRLVQICDSEMWSRLAVHVGVSLIDERLVAFRVHGKSASAVNRARPFRGSILDGIIETGKICEDPQFAPFRKLARQLGRLDELRGSLHTQLNIAFYQIRDAERSAPRDDRLRSEFKQVMRDFGGYGAAHRRHLWFRFMRMLGLVESVP